MLNISNIMSTQIHLAYAVTRVDELQETHQELR